MPHLKSISYHMLRLPRHIRQSSRSPKVSQRNRKACNHPSPKISSHPTRRKVSKTPATSSKSCKCHSTPILSPSHSPKNRLQIPHSLPGNRRVPPLLCPAPSILAFEVDRGRRNALTTAQPRHPHFDVILAVKRSSQLSRKCRFLRRLIARARPVSGERDTPSYSSDGGTTVLAIPRDSTESSQTAERTPRDSLRSKRETMVSGGCIWRSGTRPCRVSYTHLTLPTKRIV